MKLINKKVIICPETGRLGNQILNIILAISLCIENNIKLIKIPNTMLFYDKKFIVIDSSDLKSNLKLFHIKEVFFMKNFWCYNFKSFNLEKNKNKIKQILNNIFKLPKIIKYNSNVLHIHIRSGDIMEKNKGQGMVQPPCIYYENEITKKKWSKVVIVSEDNLNPCINYLVNKYDNVVYFGKNSLETDINELLSATNIMVGRGTFIPILSLFMPYLSTIHYPQDGDFRIHHFIKVFHPKKYIQHNEYKQYFIEIKKLGGWNYNNDIKTLMLNFMKNEI